MSDDTTTTTYTEAEEAFIEAFIPVVHAGAILGEAEQAMSAAEEASAPFGQALNLTDNREGLERLNALMIEAAHRAGYDDESDVVQALRFSQEAYEAELALRAALNEIGLEQGASVNPVI